MKGIKNFKRSNRKYLALLMAALTAAASLSACSGSTSGDASQSSSAKTENNGSGAPVLCFVEEHGTPAAGNFDPATFGIHFSLARMCLNRFLPTTTSRNRLRIWLSHGKHPMI